MLEVRFVFTANDTIFFAFGTTKWHRRKDHDLKFLESPAKSAREECTLH